VISRLKPHGLINHVHKYDGDGIVAAITLESSGGFAPEAAMTDA